jgi:hypothetical protein
MPGRVELRAIERTPHSLIVRAWAVDREATVTYEYPPSIDPTLIDERIAFHIAAFELNKYCALEPDTLDFGPWSRFATHAFGALWREVFRRVWAQWRFENNRPDYLGPRFDTVDDTPPLLLPTDDGTLLFCGGGKDSLVAGMLLRTARCTFASYAYAHSIYGPAAPQHDLIDRLVTQLFPRMRERVTITDDFLRPGMVAAETPSSIFGVLPIALAHGYNRLILAHERSANAPNFIWNGEPVNHQWGKSLEAERLIGEYIRRELICGLDVFSLLMPIHDVVIFELLRGIEAVRYTHSCNVRKPWCRRCPKCCYVWLGYRAHLPRALVDEIFGGEDLLAVPENAPIFRRLLSDKPFECVGEIDEARLFAGGLDPAERARLIDRYAIVSDEHRIPPDLAAAVLPLMRAAAARARA